MNFCKAQDAFLNVDLKCEIDWALEDKNGMMNRTSEHVQSTVNLIQ